MGIDDEFMEESERGWHSSDKLICPACVGDAFLRAAVASAVSYDLSCSFCGAAAAAEFDVLMEAFMVGVHNLFEQADDAGMPWDGGYVFTTYDHYDLPDEFAELGAGAHEDEVVDEVRSRLAEKTYASRWWLALEPKDAYSSAWQEFRKQIMHRTRFVFWASADDSDTLGAGEVPIARILEHIGTLLVQFDLIKTLPSGTSLYRARGHEQIQDSQGWRAADLGTNIPEKSTSASRMSPAGIPLFYGAEDVGTALAETARADGREFFTVGRFITTAPMKVIDLTAVPSVPSIYDRELGKWQGELRFLNELVEELRKPIDPGRGHLDYVPTQVFCEYFLRVFDKFDIVGLVWNSAVMSVEKWCVALDIPHESCADSAEPAIQVPQLKLESRSVTVHQRREVGFCQL